ncbi:ABC transporter permease [Fructilactobacillus cliffordii]|uniref:Iron export ABC transporter permease subunit FetB n=1 Tax=Fructilactobacillus cliffordii TaxID=2940299 RepID=A0A9Q9E2X6_9LACO|nr:iron export ABC transporter permease subunit FetB [Fructilactobacillus cliffordii]USS86122.1 iron export ABC transporter permease subunit FetB [Fructilactobacillus cliffordii]USS89197.1 iron export ABC transporter permease subunit FetB [Fructilactobacillus cliffordii]
MNNLIVSNTALALTAVFVVFAMWIGYREHLGITKDLIVATIRCVIQLFVVGYVLKYVFQVNNWLLTMLLILIIIFNGAYNARGRSGGLRNAFWISLTAIATSTLVILLVLVLDGALKFIPSQIIPVSGMIVSNSMVSMGLCFRTMNSMFKDRRSQVLEMLALGATPMIASKGIIRDAIKTGLQPTIDSAKTVGLVALPGMMSGMIFAGADPVLAIKYQIMVTFMLLGITSISSIIGCYLGYKSFFNQRDQLIR